MKKGKEASPSIILAGRDLFVKMLITLEPRYAFGSNFDYFFVFFHLFLSFSSFFFFFGLFFCFFFLNTF